MKNARMFSIAEIEQILVSSQPLAFEADNRKEAYEWISGLLTDLDYRKQNRKNKGVIQAFIRKMTGYRQTQTKRLVARWGKTGQIETLSYSRHTFPRAYTSSDTFLLAHVDEVHKTMSGPATKVILKREHEVFGKAEFERLSRISVSHIYNLRHSFAYRDKTKNYTKTKPTTCPIGERKKPEPNGIPGYIRVDSVHQGDDPIDGKGVYHINFVDEVVQFEFVGCVETISERHLAPVLEAILAMFPFVILNFHSDNGSEYINRIVAEVLNRLHIHQTKSRPRKSNDNALVETKNGAVIRKHMGYHHIPGKYAVAINRWYQDWFNGYLCFHRPCAFPVRTIDKKGKEICDYPEESYLTAYAKLKSLPNAESYLKEGLTFAQLDSIERKMSDTDYAQAMEEAKQKLFDQLKQDQETTTETATKEERM